MFLVAFICEDFEHLKEWRFVALEILFLGMEVAKEWVCGVYGPDSVW